MHTLRHPPHIIHHSVRPHTFEHILHLHVPNAGLNLVQVMTAHVTVHHYTQLRHDRPYSVLVPFCDVSPGLVHVILQPFKPVSWEL